MSSWSLLLQWLTDVHRMRTPVLVEPRSVQGAGNGLFATQALDASEALFTVPASALMNTLTLGPHYPQSQMLSCTQIICLHLMLNRREPANDPLFGPYLAVLPRDFNFHPFSWLWSRRHACETEDQRMLLDFLPPGIHFRLSRMMELYRKDWKAVKKYLKRRNLGLDLSSGEADFLWAWLNVNTRCIYQRISKTKNSPDNMTLCPILDFANHTAISPFVFPKATHGELWDTGPSPKRKFGDDFTLLAPTDGFTAAGTQLYLRYGLHTNATLFTEYGFVNRGPREDVSDEAILDSLVEDMFQRRGELGEWMKTVLTDEGYWGDWTLHTDPEPAHPSYRLMMALRMYHLFPAGVTSMPSDGEALLEIWRDTMLGKRSSVSDENETAWRSTLRQLCAEQAEKGLEAIVRVQGTRSAEDWVQQGLWCSEQLWIEHVDTVKGVMMSIDQGIEF